MNRYARLLSGLVLVLPAMGQAHAQDNAQICMFRCAPVIGTAKYDACLSECFGEEEGETGQESGSGSASPVDISGLHGFWQQVATPCGTVSYEFLDIGEDGVSFYEAACTIQSGSHEGATYTLNQLCEFGDTWDSVTRIRSIRSDEIEVDGERYRKCPRP